MRALRQGLYGSLLATAGLLTVLPHPGECRPASTAPPDTSTRSVQIQLAGRPLAEIAAAIAKEGHVRVTVDPEVRTWKATVAYRGETEHLLADLAANFGLVLERVAPPENRGGAEPPARVHYRLRLPEAERKRLAANADARDHRRRAEAEQNGQLLVDHIRNLLDRIDTAREAEFEGVAGELASPGGKSLLRLLGTFDPASLKQLTTPATNTDSDGRTGTVTVPAAALSPMQRGLLSEALHARFDAIRQGGAGGQGGFADLFQDALSRLDGAALSFWIDQRNGSQTLGMSVNLPGVRLAPSVPILGTLTAPVLAELKRKQSGAEDAQGPAPHKAEASKPSDQPEAASPLEKTRITASIQDRDYPAALAELHAASRMNIIGDAFTLREHLDAFPKDQPLKELLRRVDSRFHTRHTWRGGTLLVRSRSWEERLENEPSAAVLDLLIAALKRDRFVSWKELGRVAPHLEPAKLVGVENWRDGRLELRTAAEQMRQQHLLLQWCGMLTGGQMSRLGETGIGVASLTLGQRAALLSVARQQGAGDQLAAASRVLIREDRRRIPPLVALEIQSGDGRTLAVVH